MLNLILAGFFEKNQHYFIFGALLFSLFILIFVILNYRKSAKLSKSLLVNKFKVIDLCEKNTQDESLLYTVIISNSSVNAITISSIGFCHDGNFYNFKNEARSQLAESGHDLIIAPRASIKLRLFTQQLESVIFKNTTVKRLKAVKVYIIGLNGETYQAKTKVISKKMKEKYKEYYAFNKTEIIDNFVSKCALKTKKGVKLTLAEKIKLALWKKYASQNLPTLLSPKEEYAKCNLSPAPETTFATPHAVKDCEIVSDSINDEDKILEITDNDLGGETAKTETTSDEEN